MTFFPSKLFTLGKRKLVHTPFNADAYFVLQLHFIVVSVWLTIVFSLLSVTAAHLHLTHGIIVS